MVNSYGFWSQYIVCSQRRFYWQFFKNTTCLFVLCKMLILSFGLWQDPRFPLGMGVETERGVSAIAVPLLHGNNLILGNWIGLMVC